MDLQGKIAVITGGASGLGLATAEAYIAKGARVMIFDLNEQAAQGAVEKLGTHAAYALVNVADEASVVAGVARTMEIYGAIHVCVNCAGIGSAARTVGKNGPMALELFTRVININLVGTFNVLRLCAAEMQKNTPNEHGERGVVINTASVAAFDGQVGQVAYAASKGGIVGMTLPIARDLAAIGVRVMTIAPGIFNTPLMNAAPDAVKLPLIEMTQFPKRLGHPHEYAQLAAQIVENPFLNGETIRIDGAIRMAPK